MNVYRVPPSPLPSMRDFYREAEAAAWEDSDGHGGDAVTWARRVGLGYPEDLGLLTIHVRKHIPRKWPRLAAVIEDALKGIAAERRAAAVRPPWSHYFTGGKQAAA